MKENPFGSVEAFQQRFIDGLEKLLGNEDNPPKLGHFILVAANILLDQTIYERMSKRLQARFEQLQDKFLTLLSTGRVILDPGDDQLVFLKFALLGWQKLNLVERKKVGIWIVQFNQVRSFRPFRQAAEKITSLRKRFNPREFHYNKPFLKSEIFWEGRLADRKASVFYNKFPFTSFHLNIVPDCEDQKPQFLTKGYHQYAWNAAQELSNLDGFGMGYNSLGAFASVNHLHFQMFVSETSLPVIDEGWRHNGGSEDYPAKCIVFDSLDESWQWLRKIHSQKIAYNLLYLSNRVFCFPRKFQGTYEQSVWTSGFAWYEMSGGFITFNQSDFDSLSEIDIVGAFQPLKI